MVEGLVVFAIDVRSDNAPTLHHHVVQCGSNRARPNVVRVGGGLCDIDSVAVREAEKNCDEGIRAPRVFDEVGPRI
jgi:hypothetical protein